MDDEEEDEVEREEEEVQVRRLVVVATLLTQERRSKSVEADMIPTLAACREGWERVCVYVWRFV